MTELVAIQRALLAGDASLDQVMRVICERTAAICGADAPRGFDERAPDVLRILAGFLGTALVHAAAQDGENTLERAEFERLAQLERLHGELRFTPDGGRIELSFEASELRIGNTGPAIPEAERTRVFEKFAQAGRSGRSNFGLGLYFCRLVAEAHGTSITIESTEDLPTILVIRFPMPRRPRRRSRRMMRRSGQHRAHLAQ